MLKLYYREEFYKDLKNIKDTSLRNRIVKKTLEFENRDEPMGKKLESVPYWSVRVANYRIIFEKKGDEIDFYRILARKFNYRELR